jgi:type II secretory pathway pseudopilin PulG
MSLVELMVAMAIMLALTAVAVPSLAGIFQLRERKAAKQLVLTYQRLHDEAALRNRTFRLIYDLDADKMKIEVGEARAVIYTTAEQREKYEESERRKVAMMDDEELALYKGTKKPFDKLSANFKDEWELPNTLEFGGVYTPQYGKMMTREDLPDEPDEGTRLIYSYVFASGFTEHTVIWLTERKDPKAGWTVVVEPLSGVVHLHGELIDWEDTVGDLPDEGPDLPS